MKTKLVKKTKTKKKKKVFNKKLVINVSPLDLLLGCPVVQNKFVVALLQLSGRQVELLVHFCVLVVNLSEEVHLLCQVLEAREKGDKSLKGETHLLLLTNTLSVISRSNEQLFLMIKSLQKSLITHLFMFAVFYSSFA